MFVFIYKKKSGALMRSVAGPEAVLGQAREVIPREGGGRFGCHPVKFF